MLGAFKINEMNKQRDSGRIHVIPLSDIIKRIFCPEPRDENRI